jgi:hypothetical protein
MPSAYAKEQSVAISAVLKASLLAQKVQQQLIGSGGVEKKDKSPVTGSSRFPRADAERESEQSRWRGR